MDVPPSIWMFSDIILWTSCSTSYANEVPVLLAAVQLELCSRHRCLVHRSRASCQCSCLLIDCHVEFVHHRSSILSPSSQTSTSFLSTSHSAKWTLLNQTLSSHAPRAAPDGEGTDWLTHSGCWPSWRSSRAAVTCCGKRYAVYNVSTSKRGTTCTSRTVCTTFHDLQARADWTGLVMRRKCSNRTFVHRSKICRWRWRHVPRLSKIAADTSTRM